MKTFIRFLMAAPVALLLVCCAQTEQVVIISTNDIHSAIDGIPALATVVKQEREKNPDRVLLFDAGDRWTGNPFVDRTQDKYSPIITLMNLLEYDLATFGNHEWDCGETMLADKTSRFEFRKVLANVDPATTLVRGIEPYRIIEVCGLKLAVLGLVTVDEGSGHPVGVKSNFGDTVFEDPLAVADRYASLADSADVYVALTHIGLTRDSLLAVRRPEIDLIIGGHSHDTICPPRHIGNALVTQTGKGLGFAGITTITHRGGKVKKIENRLVELAGVEPDSTYKAIVDVYNNAPELIAAVATLDVPLDKNGLLNLFSDIVRESCRADISFYNMGGMRLKGLDGGEVIYADIYRAEPFDNYPVTVEMTPEDIAALIMNKFNSTDDESHMVDLYPSGLSYTIVTDGEGNATDIVFEPALRPGRKYTVAMSNYINGAYDFPQRSQGMAVGGTIADLVVEHLHANPDIKGDNTRRVSVD